MTDRDAWEEFLTFSESDKDAVFASIDHVLNLPRSKAHRYIGEQWGAFTELRHAIREGRRPTKQATSFLPDFLPGGTYFRAASEGNP